MSNLHSVSELLQQLEDDRSEAAQQLWDRFIHRLIGSARRHLRNLPRRAVDEEDVALSAFDAFFRGVKEQRFTKLQDRDDLWQILTMLAERKAIAVMRRELAEKRGGGLNRGESVFEKLIAESSIGGGIDQVEDPNAAVVDGFTRGVREMLEGLGDNTLREVAMRRLEGNSNAEISEQLGIASRTVERKLQLIRAKWRSI